MEANKVVAARRQMGLSQSKFAKLINTPVATVRGWELGKKPPPCLFVLTEMLLKRR